MGIHERAEDPKVYAALYASPRWRSAFSDSWESEFTMPNGRRYTSVRQAIKEEMADMVGVVEEWTVRLAATYAKFSQNTELRVLLLQTRDAQLFEIIRGKMFMKKAWWLENVRGSLQDRLDCSYLLEEMSDEEGECVF